MNDRLQWFRELAQDTYHSLYIVSVDLCASSKLSESLGSLTTVQKVMRLMRDSFSVWARRCDGVRLNWAGDGGAFLFDGRSTRDNKGKGNALRFALGIRSMSWKGSLGLEQLQAHATSADPTALVGRLVAIAQKVDEYRKDSHWEKDYAVGVTDRGLLFRIVCHRGELCVNPKDPELVWGDPLSYVLKYERELGIAHGITITSEFGRCDGFEPVQGIDVPRRSGNRKPTTIWIHPAALVPELQLNVSAGLAAAHIKTKRTEPNLLVRKIVACFDEQEGGRADVYNIGLGTFAYSLQDLWCALARKKVRIRLLLLDGYSDPNGKPHKTEQVLKEALRKGLELLPGGVDRGEVVNLLENAVEARILPSADAQRHEQFGNLLGLYFGCSLYYPGARQEPVEGSNVFLTAPYSNWEPFGGNKDVSGYWNYQRALYFTDAHAESYLKDLAGRFEAFWVQATRTLDKLPFETA